MVFRCASVWRSSSFQVLVNQLLMPKPSCRAFNLPPPREVLPPPILNLPGSTVGAGPALLPELEETLGFFGKTLSSCAQSCVLAQCSLSLGPNLLVMRAEKIGSARWLV